MNSNYASQWPVSSGRVRIDHDDNVIDLEIWNSVQPFATLREIRNVLSKPSTPKMIRQNLHVPPSFPAVQV
jgi:hypothetical protein